jgi:hypothetical protein
LAGEPYRAIAQRFAASPDALLRHKRDHLPATLAKAREVEEVARADDLLAQVRDLQGRALRILSVAEGEGDLKTALQGIREARGCLELLAELTQQLDRRPTVNILLAPEWATLRAAILDALWPYRDARVALARALDEIEVGA